MLVYNKKKRISRNLMIIIQKRKSSKTRMKKQLKLKNKQNVLWPKKRKKSGIKKLRPKRMNHSRLKPLNNILPN